MSKKNTMGLRSYLEEKGLDINRVREEGLDETGFDYIRQDYQGRPMYGPFNKFLVDRIEWPDESTFKVVQLLIEGRSLQEALEAANKKMTAKVKAKADKTIAEQEEPIKVEPDDKQATPAKARQRADQQFGKDVVPDAALELPTAVSKD